MRPYDIDLPKTRIGSNGDGGYVMADRFRSAQRVLSLGVGNNSDFEWQLACQGHKISLFDPTVDSPARPHGNFRFFKAGVAGEDQGDKPYLSLLSILSKTDVLNRSDSILKMDVEGAEYEALSKLPPERLNCFDQVVLELHHLNRLADAKFRMSFMDAIEPIAERFTLFHVHANNCAPVTFVGGGERRHAPCSWGVCSRVRT
ncbi:hypothetical protein F6X53_22665 [Methylobacterium soli]|uniref:Methyltransferase FkbM domain-containing protein n=1 Tax=Methylobacterium soli TaxID=553447 RepID=A0A6L3SWJ0_9HYPH|nr:hypothetical protein F6X53_22665 [Methylobacterium soli]